MKFKSTILFALVFTLAAPFWADLLPGSSNVQAEARSRHHRVSSTRRASSGASKRSRTTKASTRSSGRTRVTRHATTHKAAASKPKYAYPLDFFMMHPPALDTTALDEGAASDIRHAFNVGTADDINAERLVKAGVFRYHPLSGGIFRRREPVKYIVLHSTETGPPVPAKNVINAWNSMGRRHPGAQFVVDRDGTIYLALDPDLASVHVNIFKTLPGINNDNTIGIEMNHTGRQNYPLEQREAVKRLVTYLQHRFDVTSENVITHRYAQQGDHTDPVNFDLDGFLASKEVFRQHALALKPRRPKFVIEEETEDEMPLASVYVQIHGLLKLPNLESLAPAIMPQALLERMPPSSARFFAGKPGANARTDMVDSEGLPPHMN
ncbi:MAG: peptidoglycan recognition protein family protein [Candidatus Obscuribacterales bacterium]|jgi:hypothetical protein|nr:peptidoglycan recognition protein family protein [Candidatus Obscuribacterales bacterium]